MHSDIIWFTPVAVLTSNMKQVVGGWSRMLKEFLVLLLTAPDAGFQTSGVPLDLGGGMHCLLYAELRMLLSDGDGLRMALEWMGSSSTKPCFKHLNVLHKGGSDLVSTNPNYVTISCDDHTKFEAWREKDFLEAIDLIVEARASQLRGTLSKAKLETIERAFGFRATAEGLLASTTLRSLVCWQRVLRYDWVHTFLSEGVLTTVAWKLVAGAEEAGVASQSDLHDFLKLGWTKPLHNGKGGRNLWRIFNEFGAKANSSHATIKCSASELLTLYALLRHYAETRLRHPALAGKVQVFFLACKAVDNILLAKRGLLPMAEAGANLRECLQRYLACHLQVYGNNGVIPKTHWAFDVADQLCTDKWVFDAFAIERLHLRVRTIADNVHNLRQFETSVLSGVVNYHSAMCQQCIPGCGLTGRTHQPEGHPGVLLSDKLDLGGKQFAFGDFVARGEEVGVVVACCVEGQDLFIVVDLWSKATQVSQHSSTWEGARARRVVWRAIEVLEVVAWVRVQNQHVLVIHM